MTVTIYTDDARQVLAELPDRSAHCCVTSPPYYGLTLPPYLGIVGVWKTTEDSRKGRGEARLRSSNRASTGARTRSTERPSG